MDAATQGLKIEGKGKFPGQDFRQQKRLVESPFPQAFPMEGNGKDTVVFFNGKGNADTGSQQIAQDGARRDDSPVFEVVNRFEKHGLVSSDGTASFKGRPRCRAPETERVFSRFRGKRRAAARANRR